MGFTLNPSSQIVSNTRSNDAFSFTGHANQNVADTVNGLNQVAATGATSVSHDARGNVSAIGASSFGYTSENMMATAPGGATLAYDPLLRLYETAGGGATTRFGYDGLSLIAEYDGANALQRRYVHGAGVDQPLVWYEGTGTATRRWFHADERGSVVAVSDANGDLYGTANRYDEYGVPQGTLTGRFGYTGQAWLLEIGLYHYRARIYNPSVGRFMQADPIGYEGGMNLYAYVGNNPVNFRDPLGLDDDDETTVRGCSPGYARVSGVCVSDNLYRLGLVVIGDGFVTVTVPGDSPIGLDPNLTRNVSGRSVTCQLPAPEHRLCPTGGYNQYTFGYGYSLALFSGIQTSTQIGVSMHDNGTLRGMQYFVSVQGSATLSFGGFIGGGPFGGVGHTDGPLQPSGEPFAYGEFDVGWGPSLSLSAQSSPSGASGPAGLPIPRLGAGYGLYAGVGAGYGRTLATKPMGCDG